MASTEEYEEVKDSIKNMLDAENISRWVSSGLSGISIAGRLRGGVEALAYEDVTKELTAEQIDNMSKEKLAKLIEEGFKDVWKEAGWDKRAISAIQGDVGEGYAAGLKDTSDYWKHLFSSTDTIDDLSIAANPFIETTYNYEDEWKLKSPWQKAWSDWGEEYNVPKLPNIEFWDKRKRGK